MSGFSQSTLDKAASTHLSGLDPDLQEYITSMLESLDIADASEVSDMRATIVEFLVDSEYCCNDEDGGRKVDGLLEELKGSKESEKTEEEAIGKKTNAIEVGEDEGEILTVVKLKVKDDDIKKVDDAPANNNFNFEDNCPLPSAMQQPTPSSTKPIKEKKVKKGKGSSGKKTSYDIALELEEELSLELEAAKIKTVQDRMKIGEYYGAIESSEFVLPNPGGGQPLLEDASLRMVRGKRYALIGRNGKGKSTLLKALAARRVGQIPSNVSMHYVSQDVVLTDITKNQLPIQVVLAADIERTMLLEENKKFSEMKEMDEKMQKRQSQVIEQLEFIGSDSAERRAKDLLDNLGFSEDMQARPLQEMSGGWRGKCFLSLLSCGYISIQFRLLQENDDNNA